MNVASVCGENKRVIIEAAYISNTLRNIIMITFNFANVTEPVIKQNLVSMGFGEPPAGCIIDVIKALIDNRLNDYNAFIQQRVETEVNKLRLRDDQLEATMQSIGAASDSDSKNQGAAMKIIASKVNTEVIEMTHEMKQLTDEIQAKVGELEAWQRDQDKNLYYLHNLLVPVPWIVKCTEDNASSEFERDASSLEDD